MRIDKYAVNIGTFLSWVKISWKTFAYTYIYFYLKRCINKYVNM